MDLNKTEDELEKYKISKFLNEEEINEINQLSEEIERIEIKITKCEKHKKMLDKRIDSLNKRKIKLVEESKGSKYKKISMSQYILNNFSREELIIILDDFLQYKDYFENPPEEAYQVDDWDYCLCKEAKEIEQLLYKYEIYDTEYSVVKLPIMERKYNCQRIPLGFSREKLTLDEILAVLTWLHRGERWCGGFFNEAIKEGTFYNLLKRMEEIRNEL